MPNELIARPPATTTGCRLHRRTMAMLVALLVLANVVVAGEPVALLPVDNFEDAKGLSQQGQEWASYDDSHSGGQSTIAIARVPNAEAGKALQLTVKFGRGFAYPFGGAQTFLQKGGVPRDMRGYTGIKLRTKGEYVYNVRVLLANVTDYNEFSAEVDSKKEWSEVKIPFTAFAQSPFWGKQVTFDASGVRAFGFHIAGIPGAPPVEIVVDDIAFY